MQCSAVQSKGSSAVQYIAVPCKSYFWQVSTETDRRDVYKMDRQTNRQKREMPLKFIKFYKIFFTGTRMWYYIWSISAVFPCFLHFSVYLFQRHVLFPFLWHLVCPSASPALTLLWFSNRREKVLKISPQSVPFPPIFRTLSLRLENNDTFKCSTKFFE